MNTLRAVATVLAAPIILPLGALWGVIVLTNCVLTGRFKSQ